MEMRSRFATGRAVEALLNLAPPTARRVRESAEEDVPLEAIAVDDILAVRPGPMTSLVITPSSRPPSLDHSLAARSRAREAAWYGQIRGG